MKANPATLTAIGGLFVRKKFFERAAARHACRIDAELALTDSEVVYDGRIINLSLGGAMFRPPLAHLMYRANLPIRLVIGDLVITGELMTTTPLGFGLRFDVPLPPAQLQALLDLTENALAAAN